MSTYARQAIQTKYLSPTNTRPARVKVWCQAKTMVLAWDHGAGVDDNHHAAAMDLADQLGWKDIAGFGALPDGGYVLVFAAK